LYPKVKVAEERSQDQDCLGDRDRPPRTALRPDAKGVVAAPLVGSEGLREAAGVEAMWVSPDTAAQIALHGKIAQHRTPTDPDHLCDGTLRLARHQFLLALGLAQHGRDDGVTAHRLANHPVGDRKVRG
jgi:hypothetical protein